MSSIMAETEDIPDLYDTDILLWSEQQAKLLRRRAANALDWDNLVEEIEAVGRNKLHAVMLHLRLALLHDLEAEAWPQSSVGAPRRACIATKLASVIRHRWHGGSMSRNSNAMRGAACRRRSTGSIRCRCPRPAR
jgi:hypothetical protein